jgi:hypothetical protein
MKKERVERVKGCNHQADSFEDAGDLSKCCLPPNLRNLYRAAQHSSNWSPNFSFIILIFSSQEAAAAPSRVLCRLADALFAGLRPESAAAVLSWVASRAGSGNAATPPPAREGAVGADAAGACLAVGSEAAATVAKSAETAPIAAVSLGRACGCAWACFVGRARVLAGGGTTSCGRMDGR